MPNPTVLANDVETLKALIVASEDRNLRKQDRIDQLEKLVSDFKRALFGTRSEKADPEQFELSLEDIETAMAVVHAEDEAVDSPASRPAKPRNTNRGSPPKHQPRIEEEIVPDSHPRQTLGRRSCGHNHRLARRGSRARPSVPRPNRRPNCSNYSAGPANEGSRQRSRGCAAGSGYARRGANHSLSNRNLCAGSELLSPRS